MKTFLQQSLKTELDVRLCGRFARVPQLTTQGSQWELVRAVCKRTPCSHRALGRRRSWVLRLSLYSSSRHRWWETQQRAWGALTMALGSAGTAWAGDGLALGPWAGAAMEQSCELLRGSLQEESALETSPQ